MTDHQIEILSALVSGGAGQAVNAYTWYFIAASVVWLVVGVSCLVGAYVLSTKARASDKDQEAVYWLGGWVAPAILVLTGVLISASNLSDLLAPQAAGIHQLLSDISRK